MAHVAALGGGRPLAWWLTLMTVGPLLGSFITEPAAMTITALLWRENFYRLNPSRAFKHATLGLLFVNVSVGGTLTNFAAPPVLMVAGVWGWDTWHMFADFGWKAAVGIVAGNLVYAVVFRREWARLAAHDVVETELDMAEGHWASRRDVIPWWVTAVHVAALGWTVFTAHFTALYVGGFLALLAFSQTTEQWQGPLNLRSPILVGFFLAGLVIHGTLQAWWIEPVLGSLGNGTLMAGAVGLTAFSDNAALTYLASLVPDLTEAQKHAVMAGAVTGGGLTVIANAPNPAGQAVLGRSFGHGVSPLGLALAAAVPTVIVGAALAWLP